VILGNDIVALDSRSGRSGQPLFYSKIITPAEKALYAAERFPDLSFEHFVWLCWAVKEAAFKCIARVEPGALFWGPRITITQLGPLTAAPGEPLPAAPGKCCLDTGAALSFHHYSAVARFNAWQLQAWAAVNSDLILAVATPGDTFCHAAFGHVHWGIRRLDSADPARQSAGVREFVLEKLQRVAPGQPLSIGKSPTCYPFFASGDQVLDYGLSFSHHEDWVSYAFAPSLP